MSTNFNSSRVEIREKRLKTVLTFQGKASELAEKGHEGKLKIGKFCYGQCGDCQEGCAKGLVYGIRDAAVVSHAPIGCFATIAGNYQECQGIADNRNKGKFDHHAICTNIQEKDTIYGAGEKLRTAIRQAKKRYNPKVIFVSSSCASGIIGDDIQGIASEMQEEVGVPVVSLACEGFKSKIWSTGWDAGFNAILRAVVKAPEKKDEDIVNIFNFAGTDRFTRLLGLINLKPHYLPYVTTTEELSHISEAAASATICETLASYVAEGLEELYGVPQVKAAAPYGIRATDKWLRAVAELTGREDRVEAAIEAEHERIKERYEQLKEQLRGKKVYVFAGDSYAHNVISMARDFEMDVVGTTTYHHDGKSDSEEINTLKFMVENVGDVENYNVCNKQPYQVLKFLMNLQPELLIVRHPALAALGYKSGVPTIFDADSNLGVGYDGEIEFGERILRAFKTHKLVDNIAAHTTFPYTDWWMNQDTDAFYFVNDGKKKEVNA